jgi:putative ABC transport system substrate-binding protein
MPHRTAAARACVLALLSIVGWAADISAQTKVARVGILVTPLEGTDEEMAQYYEPFRRALARQGWIEGKNGSFEYHLARGTPPQFEEPAAELVKRNVDVIYANSAPATRAAYAATRTIPIISVDLTNDPVAAGYAQSYGRPGRNLTGVFLDAPEFAGKWLQLLRTLVPGLSRVAVLWDPAPGRAHLSAIQEAARTSGIQLQILEVRKPDDIDKAFAAFRPKTQALVILPSPMTWSQSPRIAELTVDHRLPAISMADQFAEAGGALSYGPDQVVVDERSGVLVAQVLRGTKPGEIPVERPAKFVLILNLKTAKALALAVPDYILLSADRVIR